MFFTLILGDNFFITYFIFAMKDVEKKLAPISPNGSIIQDAVVNPAHRCTL